MSDGRPRSNSDGPMRPHIRVSVSAALRTLPHSAGALIRPYLSPPACADYGHARAVGPALIVLPTHSQLAVIITTPLEGD